MRIGRERFAANRIEIPGAASRLSREKGFDGVGLDAVMKAAGLTQGAFYSRTASCAGSGNTTGFGRPSSGYSPARMTSTLTPQQLAGEGAVWRMSAPEQLNPRPATREPLRRWRLPCRRGGQPSVAGCDTGCDTAEELDERDGAISRVADWIEAQAAPVEYPALLDHAVDPSRIGDAPAGRPATTSTSARLPASRLPHSCSALMTRAASYVAARMASRGVNPDSTRSSSSRWIPSP